MDLVVEDCMMSLKMTPSMMKRYLRCVVVEGWCRQQAGPGPGGLLCYHAKWITDGLILDFVGVIFMFQILWCHCVEVKSVLAKYINRCPVDALSSRRVLAAVGMPLLMAVVLSQDDTVILDVSDAWMGMREGCTFTKKRRKRRGKKGGEKREKRRNEGSELRPWVGSMLQKKKRKIPAEFPTTFPCKC